MKKFIILILLLNAVSLNIWLSGKWEQNSSTPDFVPKVNSETEIGMDAEQVREICGEGDLLDSGESSGKKILILYYDGIDCEGTFTLVNGKLESIIR